MLYVSVDGILKFVSKFISVPHCHLCCIATPVYSCFVSRPICDNTNPFVITQKCEMINVSACIKTHFSYMCKIVMRLFHLNNAYPFHFISEQTNFPIQNHWLQYSKLTNILHVDNNKLREKKLNSF